ncbi:MAG: GSCFA domain-containing protein [Saprospiraceae bacterium]
MNNTFRTELKVPGAEIEISYQDQILMVGSCFAENIANYLQKGRFQVEVNPFGILYNPVSISDSIELLWKGEEFPEEHLVQQGELWHSFLHHGKFAQMERKKLLENIEIELKRGRTFVQQCSRLIITLGSATVYTYKASGKIVANCHKIPHSAFLKKRLGVDQCVETLSSIFKTIKQANPSIEIILTVSPVRHLRDGFTENQLSKATLLLSCAALQQVFPFVHYFPSYELIIDDLRDYRFFNTDMVHPNDIAIEYVWEHFNKTYFSENSMKIFAEVIALQSLKEHRPLFPDSGEYSRLKEMIAEKENLLLTKYPFLR